MSMSRRGVPLEMEGIFEKFRAGSVRDQWRHVVTGRADRGIKKQTDQTTNRIPTGFSGMSDQSTTRLVSVWSVFAGDGKAPSVCWSGAGSIEPSVSTGFLFVLLTDWSGVFMAVPAILMATNPSSS